MDAQRLFKSSLTRNERVAAQACDFCGLGPIYFRAASWAAAEPGNFARILEKQNRLQMSQVFPFSCIDDQMGVVFQGFYKRGRASDWRGLACIAHKPREVAASPQKLRAVKSGALIAG